MTLATDKRNQIFLPKFGDDYLHLELGQGRCLVDLMVLSTQDGLVVLITDASKTHLGATVVSLPRPSLTGDDSISCDSFVIPRQGHKDHLIAQMIAEQFCCSLGVAVYAIAGIHIDNASKQELGIIQENCQKIGDLAVQRLLAQRLEEISLEKQN